MRSFHAVTALACALGLFACSSSDTPSGGSDASTSADTGVATDAGHSDTGADASSPVDSGGGVDSSVHDAGCATPGTAAFGVICATDCDCASSACFFGGQGSYCSMHCTAATAAQDCPNPPTSGTCNNQGYCKK